MIENNKQTIIIIPGFGAQKFLFKKFIIDNSNDFKFEYIELIDYSFQTIEQKFLKILATEKEKKVGLLGWSLGCLYAIKLCSKYQHIISNLILFSGFSNFCADEKNQVSNQRKKKLEQMINLLKLKRNQTLADFYKSILKPITDNTEIIVNKLLDQISQTPTEYLINGLEVLKTDVSEIAAAIKTKTLIIHGSADIIAPIYLAQILNLLIKNSKLIILNNAGHSFFVNYNLQLSEILEILQK